MEYFPQEEHTFHNAKGLPLVAVQSALVQLLSRLWTGTSLERAPVEQSLSPRAETSLGYAARSHRCSTSRAEIGASRGPEDQNQLSEFRITLKQYISKSF